MGAGARTLLVLVPEVFLQAVVRTRGFHELSDTVLARVLRSDRLAVDELDLVQAVREWAHVSSVSAAQRGRGGFPKHPPGARCRAGCPTGRPGAPGARGGRPARAGAAPAPAGTQRAGDAGEPQPAGPAHPGELLGFWGAGFGGKLGPHSCPHPRWRASRQPGGPTRCGAAAGCPPSSAGPGAARGPVTTTGTWTQTPSRGCAHPSPTGGLGERLCPPQLAALRWVGGWALLERQ